MFDKDPRSSGKLFPTQGRPPSPKATAKALTQGGILELSRELRECMQRHQFHPAVKMIALYDHPDTSIGDKIRICSELLSYGYPRLKAIDLSGSVDHSINVNIVKFGEKLAKATATAVLKDESSDKKTSFWDT